MTDHTHMYSGKTFWVRVFVNTDCVQTLEVTDKAQDIQAS